MDLFNDSKKLPMVLAEGAGGRVPRGHGLPLCGGLTGSQNTLFFLCLFVWRIH
jgi:hypothetical protein